MDEDLKRLIEDVGAETRRHFDDVAESLRHDIQKVDGRLSDVAESLRQENAENRQQIGTVAAELRRHFDITAEDLRHQMQFCAESIVGTGERLDRRIDGLEADMKDEFAEVKAMVRFSYADLDRRLRALEDRVERLESSARPQ